MITTNTGFFNDKRSLKQEKFFYCIVYSSILATEYAGTTGLKIVLSEMIIIAAAVLFKQSHPLFYLYVKFLSLSSYGFILTQKEFKIILFVST